jgi:hypothetical protein
VAWTCTPAGRAYLAKHPGAFTCSSDGGVVTPLTKPLINVVPPPGLGSGVKVDATTPVTVAPNTSSPATGSSTSPIDSLAAQLMGGGSGGGGGGGFTAAPVEVPAASGGSSMGLIIVVVGLGVVVWLVMQRKGKGAK